MKKIKVALVPGHSFEDQNFTLWTGETEWSIGKRACEFIKDYWDANYINIDSKLFHRHKEKYYSSEMKKVAKAIEAWHSKVDLVFEHHVNAFKRIALGCEGLVDQHNEMAARFVDKMTDEFSEAFMVKERNRWEFENGERGDGVKKTTKSTRGGAAMYYYDKYGAEMSFIWEGCFGNMKHGESIRVFEDDIAYFKWLAEYMGNALGGIKKDVHTDVPVPNRPEPQTPTPISTEPIQDVKLKSLVNACKKVEIEFPILKGIVLAQWLLESGRAASKLAIEHNNFAGLKWRSEMEGHATPVSYEAHDGRTDYCKFESAEHFVKGYWVFINRSVYNGWKAHANKPKDFLQYIVNAGYCPDNGYVAKVLKLVPEAQTLMEIPPAPTPEPLPIPSTPKPPKKKSFWEKYFGWLF